MTATIGSVKVGDVDLAIAETGQGGRPLLLQHGFTGAKEDFADWWDALAERGWHVVAPDLRFALLRLFVRLRGMDAIAKFVRKPPPGSPESVLRLYAERPGFVEWTQSKVRNTSREMATVMMRELSRRPDAWWRALTEFLDELPTPATPPAPPTTPA